MCCRDVRLFSPDRPFWFAAPACFSLTEKELRWRDASYRTSPHLRTESDVQAITEGLPDGTLDAVATDHAPHTVEEKSDCVEAPNGAIGMEASVGAADA